ncbi:unnamed protein product, partial [Linum tenue]
LRRQTNLNVDAPVLNPGIHRELPVEFVPGTAPHRHGLPPPEIVTVDVEPRRAAQHHPSGDKTSHRRHFRILDPRLHRSLQLLDRQPRHHLVHLRRHASQSLIASS